MSDFNGNGEQQQPAQAAGGADAAKTIDLLADRTFRVSSRNPQTGRIDYVRIDVKDNCIRFGADLSEDGSGNWANLKLPKTEWGMFKLSLQRIATSKEPAGETFKGYVGQERRLDGTLRIGRDAEGIVSLTMGNGQGQTRMFKFELGPNTEIVDDNGVPLPPNELSRRRAIAWSIEASSIVDEEFKRKFATYEQRQAENGRGQGGGQQQGFKKPWNGGGGNGGGGFKKQWNGGGGNGGGFKKPWQQNGQGGGNGFKKPWQQNGQGGGQQQQYRPQYQQPQQQQQAAPEATISFNEYMP